jgi:hypothetical protein
MVFPGSEEAKPTVLVRAHHAQQTSDMERGASIVQESFFWTMLFTANGDGLMENAGALAFFREQLERKGKKDSNHLCLMDVLDSFAWPTEDAKDAACKAVMQLPHNKQKEQHGLVYVVEKLSKDRAREGQKEDDPSESVWQQLRFSVFEDPPSGQQTILLVAFDVSEHKKLELELIEAQKKQALFFASLCHDIRAPIHGIISLTDAIQSHGSLPEEVEKKIGVLRAAAKQLGSLANDLLDHAAAIDNGGLTMKIQEVPLQEILAEVCAIISPLLRNSVVLFNDADSKLPVVQGDRDRLTQVFMNLLGNACKYTREGSIRIASRVDKDWVDISVADTGIGIRSDKFDAIFQVPFHAG